MQPNLQPHFQRMDGNESALGLNRCDGSFINATVIACSRLSHPTLSPAFPPHDADPGTGRTRKKVDIYFNTSRLLDNLARQTDTVLTACSYLKPSLPPGRSLSFHKCAQLKRAECLERGSEGQRGAVPPACLNWIS